jgi:DNA-directed RNA polymerase specialized sigma24 family protein
MLDQRRAAIRPEERREQLFTERYEGLLAWTTRLTNQNHEAEDLVQDAFVRFMLDRTSLETGSILGLPKSRAPLTKVCHSRE